jgi:hypothetical protein
VAQFGGFADLGPKAKRQASHIFRFSSASNGSAAPVGYRQPGPPATLLSCRMGYLKLTPTHRAWVHDWKDKLATRVAAEGFNTMSELLAKCPGEPYLTIADRLGDDVAAAQIEWMHFKEAIKCGQLRAAAMDSLARDIRSHLPAGWQQAAKGHFHTAGARADWIVRIEQADANVRSKAIAVWISLEKSNPPVGWKPSGPEDALIVAAFHSGWPA